VLLVVDDDPRTRAVVAGELRKRYETDYQVVCADSGDDPARLLAKFHDDRRLVSIVLARQQMSRGTGAEVLARVREFHRTAKRLLLIDWGYGPPPEPIVRAIALDHIDAYVARPVTVPDERFHRVVTELLEEWARSHLPRFEVVRVVDEERSARSQEIRDLLDRNAIPFGFYPVGTERGKALLQQAGVAASTLPVIFLFNGRVLRHTAPALIPARGRAGNSTTARRSPTRCPGRAVGCIPGWFGPTRLRGRAGASSPPRGCRMSH
jgi:thioredoxin reductase (NADPH)